MVTETDDVKTEDLVGKFLDPDNVFAVVGVSRNKEKYGYKVYHDLKIAGYEVFPVNPNLSSVDGEKCYPSLASLPKVPDVLSVVVPPSVTEKVVKEAADVGIRKVWMQPGSESEAAIDFCLSHDILVLHDMCIMIKRRSRGE